MCDALVAACATYNGGHHAHHSMALFMALGVAVRHATYNVRGGSHGALRCGACHSVFVAEHHVYCFVALHVAGLVVLHHGF